MNQSQDTKRIADIQLQQKISSCRNPQQNIMADIECPDFEGFEENALDRTLSEKRQNTYQRLVLQYFREKLAFDTHISQEERRQIKCKVRHYSYKLKKQSKYKSELLNCTRKLSDKELLQFWDLKDQKTSDESFKFVNDHIEWLDKAVNACRPADWHMKPCSYLEFVNTVKIEISVNALMFLNICNHKVTTSYLHANLPRNLKKRMGKAHLKKLLLMSPLFYYDESQEVWKQISGLPQINDTRGRHHSIHWYGILDIRKMWACWWDYRGAEIRTECIKSILFENPKMTVINIAEALCSFMFMPLCERILYLVHHVLQSSKKFHHSEDDDMKRAVKWKFTKTYVERSVPTAREPIATLEIKSSDRGNGKDIDENVSFITWASVEKKCYKSAKHIPFPIFIKTRKVKVCKPAMAVVPCADKTEEMSDFKTEKNIKTGISEHGESCISVSDLSQENGRSLSQSFPRICILNTKIENGNINKFGTSQSKTTDTEEQRVSKKLVCTQFQENESLRHLENGILSHQKRNAVPFQSLADKEPLKKLVTLHISAEDASIKNSKKSRVFSHHTNNKPKSTNTLQTKTKYGTLISSELQDFCASSCPRRCNAIWEDISSLPSEVTTQFINSQTSPENACVIQYGQPEAMTSAKELFHNSPPQSEMNSKLFQVGDIISDAQIKSKTLHIAHAHMPIYQSSPRKSQPCTNKVNTILHGNLKYTKENLNDSWRPIPANITDTEEYTIVPAPVNKAYSRDYQKSHIISSDSRHAKKDVKMTVCTNREGSKNDLETSVVDVPVTLTNLEDNHKDSSASVPDVVDLKNNEESYITVPVPVEGSSKEKVNSCIPVSKYETELGNSKEMTSPTAFGRDGHSENTQEYHNIARDITRAYSSNVFEISADVAIEDSSNIQKSIAISSSEKVAGSRCVSDTDFNLTNRNYAKENTSISSYRNKVKSTDKLKNTCTFALSVQGGLDNIQMNGDISTSETLSHAKNVKKSMTISQEHSYSRNNLKNKHHVCVPASPVDSRPTVQNAEVHVDHSYPTCVQNHCKHCTPGNQFSSRKPVDTDSCASVVNSRKPVDTDSCASVEKSNSFESLRKCMTSKKRKLAPVCRLQCCLESEVDQDQENVIDKDVDEVQRKRRKIYKKCKNEGNLESYKYPLTIGWVREIVTRSAASKITNDIYYHSPMGKKLRSLIEVQKYLETIEAKDLSAHNFTFHKNPLGFGEPYETSRFAKIRLGGDQTLPSHSPPPPPPPASTSPPRCKNFCRRNKYAGRTEHTPREIISPDMFPEDGYWVTSFFDLKNDMATDAVDIVNEDGEVTGYEEWINACSSNKKFRESTNGVKHEQDVFTRLQNRKDLMDTDVNTYSDNSAESDVSINDFEDIEADTQMISNSKSNHRLEENILTYPLIDAENNQNKVFDEYKKLEHEHQEKSSGNNSQFHLVCEDSSSAGTDVTVRNYEVVNGLPSVSIANFLDSCSVSFPSTARHFDQHTLESDLSGRPNEYEMGCSSAENINWRYNENESFANSRSQNDNDEDSSLPTFYAPNLSTEERISSESRLRTLLSEKEGQCSKYRSNTQFENSENRSEPLSDPVHTVITLNQHDTLTDRSQMSDKVKGYKRLHKNDGAMPVYGVNSGYQRMDEPKLQNVTHCDGVPHDKFIKLHIESIASNPGVKITLKTQNSIYTQDPQHHSLRMSEMTKNTVTQIKNNTPHNVYASEAGFMSNQEESNIALPYVENQLLLGTDHSVPPSTIAWTDSPNLFTPETHEGIYSLKQLQTMRNQLCIEPVDKCNMSTEDNTLRYLNCQPVQNEGLAQQVQYITGPLPQYVISKKPIKYLQISQIPSEPTPIYMLASPHNCFS